MTLQCRTTLRGITTKAIVSIAAMVILAAAVGFFYNSPRYACSVTISSPPLGGKGGEERACKTLSGHQVIVESNGHRQASPAPAALAGLATGLSVGVAACVVWSRLEDRRSA